MKILKNSFIIVLGFLLGIFSTFFFVEYPDYSNLMAALVGAFVALLIPLWKTYVINKANLQLEINGISRKVSEKTTISLDDHSEFSYLKSLNKTESPFPFMDRAGKKDQQGRMVNIEKLGDLIDRARQDLKDLPEKISDKKSEIEKVAQYSADTFTKRECDKLNSPFYPEIEYDSENPLSTKDEFEKHFTEELSNLKSRYDELQSSFPEIERKFGQLKNTLVETSSHFEISATLINSGRLNTSIKKPALFRVYIGKENYVDLKLMLSDFESKSEVAANSTVVTKFISSNISQLPEEDRNLVNTYWGQSVQCRLFVEDVEGKATTSNSIAFSEGLYQKIIFDRLAVVATQKSG